MSKTKRTGQAARIAALEKDLRRLRAQLPREIHHAVRYEIAVEVSHGLVRLPLPKAARHPIDRLRVHALGRDSYSEAEG